MDLHEMKKHYWELGYQSGQHAQRLKTRQAILGLRELDLSEDVDAITFEQHMEKLNDLL